jgi:hypothetical protein
MADVTRQTYRQLSDDEKRAMADLKAAGEAYISAIEKLCPGGRERALAVTNAEQSVMWAVKGLTS